MRMFRHAAIVAASLSFVFAAPALAQNSPFTGGEYVQVASITIDDGHALDYENYLASQWRANQEFARTQGWITSYEVLANVNKRPGEPDLILVTRYRMIPDGAEGERRAAATRAHLSQTDAQMEAASGGRAQYRQVLGTQLWQVMAFRP